MFEQPEHDYLDPPERPTDILGKCLLLGLALGLSQIEHWIALAFQIAYGVLLSCYFATLAYFAVVFWRIGPRKFASLPRELSRFLIADSSRPFTRAGDIILLLAIATFFYPPFRLLVSYVWGLAQPG